MAIDKDTGLNKIEGAELFVIIEGCPVMCCSKIVEGHSGREPDIRVEKVSTLGCDEADKERIKQDVKRRTEARLTEKS